MTICVTRRFYIQKSRHFEKSKTICVTFFVFKNPDTLRYAIFHVFFEIGGGGGAFLHTKKNALDVYFL